MKEQLKAEAHVRNCLPALKIPSSLPLPVRLDEYTGGYIWGPDNEMIADFDEGVDVGDGFRVRGWGRIQDEQLFVENMKFIADAINEHVKPSLSDWFAVLGGKYHPHKRVVSFNRDICSVDGIDFSLSTGQPVDEASYKAFNDAITADGVNN